MRDIKSKKKFLSLKNITVLIVLSLLTILLKFSLDSFNDAKHFPIRTVKIYGLKNVDRNQLQHLISPLVHQSFFALNVENIKDRLLQLPWISNTEVKRVWPNQVIIKIDEKKPLAFWNENNLMSMSGEIFHPGTDIVSSALPHLKGPVGEQMLIMKYYLAANHLLSQLHVVVKSLELTPQWEWIIFLNNGIKMTINNKEILTKLEHFVKVYPKIIGDRSKQVEYIDLRYSNGFAVGWKMV